MGLPRFFPEQEIHRFDYKPLYYDPKKEEMQERIARIRKELGKEDAKDVRILTKGTFKRYYERKHESIRKSNFRIFGIAALLAALIYWFIYM